MHLRFAEGVLVPTYMCDCRNVSYDKGNVSYDKGNNCTGVEGDVGVVVEGALEVC